MPTMSASVAEMAPRAWMDGPFREVSVWFNRSLINLDRAHANVVSECGDSIGDESVSEIAKERRVDLIRRTMASLLEMPRPHVVLNDPDLAATSDSLELELLYYQTLSRLSHAITETLERPGMALHDSV